ncbi:MAG: helix-turn-helix domain-containing protein [Elusimicrobiales bacterium]|nr:helix-turn-helix domain-containing protein [Elusimicrobiales bacterium]
MSGTSEILPEYFTTGEAAREIGVPEHELRYWEKQKLLIPMRISSGHRRYRRRDIQRGALIRDLFKQGYSSKGIKQLLSSRQKNKNAAQDNAAEISKASRRKDMLIEVKKELQDLMKILKQH